jgi:hypothetical protein
MIDSQITLREFRKIANREAKGLGVKIKLKPMLTINLNCLAICIGVDHKKDAELWKQLVMRLKQLVGYNHKHVISRNRCYEADNVHGGYSNIYCENRQTEFNEILFWELD